MDTHERNYICLLDCWGWLACADSDTRDGALLTGVEDMFEAESTEVLESARDGNTALGYHKRLRSLRLAILCSGRCSLLAVLSDTVLPRPSSPLRWWVPLCGGG